MSYRKRFFNFLFKLGERTGNLKIISILHLLEQRGIKDIGRVLKNRSFKTGEVISKFLYQRSHRKALEKIISENQNKPVIIFPPHVEWNIPLFQRPQHIAKNLGLNDFLFFYCTPNYIDKVNGFVEVSRNCFLTNRLDLLESFSLKKVYNVYSTNFKLTPEYIKYQISQGNLILYEYIDEIHEDISGYIPQAAKKAFQTVLENEVCMVVATADKLFKEVGKHRRVNFSLVTNGVDYAHFSQSFTREVIPDEIRGIVDEGKPIIGYFGALAKWVDTDLLVAMARMRPDYNILLIGWKFSNDLRWRSINETNITIIGPIDYSVLPRYAFWFDVCMIPFLINEITESTSPIKLFEYMALSKPIVTTAIPESRKYQSVLIGENHLDFIQKIDHALSLRNDAHYKETLRKDALDNTWDAKAKEIGKLIELNVKSMNANRQ